MRRIPKIAGLQYLSNISRKKRGVNLIFYIKLNIKISCKFSDTIVFGDHSQACQKFQNSTFARYFQYLKNGQVYRLSCVMRIISFICHQRLLEIIISMWSMNVGTGGSVMIFSCLYVRYLFQYIFNSFNKV